jgi:hypothetical protein
MQVYKAVSRNIFNFHFKYEDDSLVEYNAVQSRRSRPTFQRFVLPPSSGRYTLMMEAVSTSETSISFNEVTRRYIPQGCHLHSSRSENLNYNLFEGISNILNI